MQIIQTLSYRHADAILTHNYPSERQEILDVISCSSWVKVAKPKPRKRKGKIVCLKEIIPTDSNKVIEREFKQRDWSCQPKIVSASESNLKADFRKKAIQVEVQFGNMARWYTDVFKFLLSYSIGDIEIGVLIVPMQNTAKRIDENVVYFERIARELPHAKMGITIPVWVIGIE